MTHGLKLTLGDMLLMSAVLAIAVGLFLLPWLSEEAAYAEIVMAESGEVRRISLDTDADYEVSARGVQLTVRVADGAVSVSDADCRDGICRRTPAISRAGQSIVCAPAGVVVRVIGTGEEGVVDGVSG